MQGTSIEAEEAAHLNDMIDVVLVEVLMERELGDEHQERHEADRYGPFEPAEACMARPVARGVPADRGTGASGNHTS